MCFKPVAIFTLVWIALIDPSLFLKLVFTLAPALLLNKLNQGNRVMDIYISPLPHSKQVLSLLNKLFASLFQIAVPNIRYTVKYIG